MLRRLERCDSRSLQGDDSAVLIVIVVYARVVIPARSPASDLSVGCHPERYVGGRLTNVDRRNHGYSAGACPGSYAGVGSEWSTGCGSFGSGGGGGDAGSATSPGSGAGSGVS